MTVQTEDYKHNRSKLRSYGKLDTDYTQELNETLDKYLALPCTSGTN